MNRCDKLRELMAENEAVYISSYPNIFYYSGFTSEDARLIITKSRQILLTDSRYTVQAHLQSPEFELYDIISDREKVIKSLGAELLCFEEEHITVSGFSALQKYGIKLKPFSKTISVLRQVKDDEEIKKISEAERLGDEAFGYITERIKAGRSEREISLELEFYMKKNGAASLSFETICASGVRSAMPHGVASDKLIEAGDFVTLDFGCILDGYCSDMTRTVVIGKASDRQREIYEVVLTAQRAALAVLKEGLTCADGDRAAREIIEQAGYAKFFGHSTGHSVGIEIHENPNLSPKSKDILKAGNIVTVEPGIYIEDFGGVRIEDLVQITSQGIVNLTNSEKELLII